MVKSVSESNNQLVHIVRKKKEDASFYVFWREDGSDIKDSAMHLDFRPIITEYNLKGNFLLLHWQAKPVGKRRWGIYDGANDIYHSLVWDKVYFDLVTMKLLQLDEKKHPTKPTAVILLDDATLTFKDNKYYITSV